MSGSRSLSQASMLSSRWRIELTFQVAMRIHGSGRQTRINQRFACLPVSAGICTQRRLYARRRLTRPLRYGGNKSSSAELGSAWAGPLNSPGRQSQMTKRKWLFGVAALALIGIALLVRGLWTSDGAAARSQGAARVVPVEVATAERKADARAHRVARQRHPDRQRRHQGAGRYRDHSGPFPRRRRSEERRSAVHARRPPDRGGYQAGAGGDRRRAGDARAGAARRRALYRSRGAQRDPHRHAQQRADLGRTCRARPRNRTAPSSKI